MKVLVAAPTAQRKSYCFKRWADYTARYADRLVAIEDWEAEYIEEVRALGVPVAPYTPQNMFRLGANAIYGPRFNEAWQEILNHADGFDFIMSLETDVIPPEDCDIVQLMLDNYTGEDFLCHGNPWRYPSKMGGYGYEFACTLMKPATVKRALDIAHPNVGIYGFTRWIDHFTHKDILIVELDHVSREDGKDDRLE